MKTKSLVSICVVFIISLVIFAVSCKKEHGGNDNLSKDSTTLSISAARKIFYKTLRYVPLNNLSIQSTDEKAKAKLYPNWHKAKLLRTNLYDMVEVPVLSVKMSFILYSFSAKGQPARQPDKSILGLCFKRLVMYKDKAGVLKERIITYLPDREYLLKHHNDATHNYINQLDSDFSGYLEYSNWDQNIDFVLRIENGKAVRKLVMNTIIHHVPGKNDVVTNSTASKLKTNGECEYCSPVYEEECITAGEDSDNPDAQPQTTCTTVQVGEDCTPYTCDEGGGGDDPCLLPENMNTAECGNDGGAPDPGCPNCPPPPNPPKDPCKEKVGLNNILSSIALTNANASIRASTANSGTSPLTEYGGQVKVNSLGGAIQPVTTTPGTYVANDPIRNGTWSIPEPTWDANSGYTIGWAHTHVDEAGPSPADVIAMIVPLYVTTGALSAGTATPADRAYYEANVFVETLTPSTTYMTTINNKDDISDIFNHYAQIAPNAIDIEYQNRANTYIANNPTASLGDASSYALKSIFGDAINFYKSPANSNNFVPITASGSGNTATVGTNPCNP